MPSQYTPALLLLYAGLDVQQKRGHGARRRLCVHGCMPSQYTLALLLHAAGVAAGVLALCSLQRSAAQKQNLGTHGAGRCQHACMGMGMRTQHALALLVLAQGYLCLVWLATYSMASYVPNFLFRTRLTPEQQARSPASPWSRGASTAHTHAPGPAGTECALRLSRARLLDAGATGAFAGLTLVARCQHRAHARAWPCWHRMRTAALTCTPA